MNIRTPRTGGGLAVVLLAAPLTVSALDIVPRITVGEIYTSNVNLEPQGESEWITRVAPGVEITYEGPRLDLRADYTFEALFYLDVSDRNEAYNQLSSSALLDVIGEELQLRGEASISQVNLAPEESVTNSNINVTGNRTDAVHWSVGPQWAYPVFGGSELDGFAFVGDVIYDGETQNVHTISGRASLHTDASTNPTVTYDLAYEYDRLEYEISGETLVQTAYLELGYRINETFGVFALGGLDNNFISTATTDDSLDETRWEVGASAGFTADSLRIAVGHRHFGSTFSFDWDHVAGEATFGLSYDESPTTSDLAVLRELPTGAPSEEPVPPPPDSDINRPGNPTRYVRKRADADATWSFSRSTLRLNAFWEDREDQVLVTEEPVETPTLGDETSYGFDANFSWELGSRSVAEVGAGWRHRELNQTSNLSEPGTDDVLYTLEAGLDYTLGPRTTLGFGTGWRSRDGATADTSSDYDEFWASAELVRTF